MNADSTSFWLCSYVPSQRGRRQPTTAAPERKRNLDWIGKGAIDVMKTVETGDPLRFQQLECAEPLRIRLGGAHQGNAAIVPHRTDPMDPVGRSDSLPVPSDPRRSAPDPGLGQTEMPSSGDRKKRERSRRRIPAGTRAWIGRGFWHRAGR